MADGYAELEQDHRSIEAHFQTLASNTESPVVRELAELLTRHSQLEEAALYPALRRWVDGGDDLADRAQQEHAQIATMVSELYQSVTPERLGELVASLQDVVSGHVAFEESEIFPAMRESGVDAEQVAAQPARGRAAPGQLSSAPHEVEDRAASATPPSCRPVPSRCRRAPRVQPRRRLVRGPTPGARACRRVGAVAPRRGGRHGSRRARRDRRRWRAPGLRGIERCRPSGRRAGRRAPSALQPARRGSEVEVGAHDRGAHLVAGGVVAGPCAGCGSVVDLHQVASRQQRGRLSDVPRPAVQLDDAAVGRGVQVADGALALEQRPRSRSEHLVVVVDDQGTERATVTAHATCCTNPRRSSIAAKNRRFTVARQVAPVTMRGPHSGRASTRGATAPSSQSLPCRGSADACSS